MTLPTDQLSDNLDKLSNLYILQSLLVQMQTNIALVSQGADGQKITVNGANLYQLAAQYYGDASLWTTIAKANNLVDPFVPSGTAITLAIPAQTNDTQGIYQS